MEQNLVTLIAELKKPEAIQVTEQRIAAGEDSLKILDDARKAMQIVGGRFSDGTYFIPDLVYSGKILEEIAALVKPGLSQTPESEKLAKIVIGTVAGDLHDIGKDLVTFMLDINGFEVLIWELMFNPRPLWKKSKRSSRKSSA